MSAPLAGLETGIYRKWCSLNLLAMLDDRNFHGVSGLPDHHGLGSELRGRAGMGPQLQPAYSSLTTPSLARSGQARSAKCLLNGAITNRDDIYLTDGVDAATNGGPWVDAAERDRRLDLVDQILGDATPRA